MTAHTLHRTRPALTLAPAALSRILFTFAALLAVLLQPRPAAPLVIPPWTERHAHPIGDAEWGDAIRAMARRMAPIYAAHQ